MRRIWRDPVVVIGAVVVLAALLFGLVYTAGWPDAEPSAGEQGSGEVLALDDVDDLSDVVGQRVAADDAEVQGVPADEGFWVSTGGERAWVQLTTAGESPFAVRAGQHVSFSGQVVAHGPDFAQRPEFSAADADELVDAGAHVEVDVGDVRLAGSG